MVLSAQGILKSSLHFIFNFNYPLWGLVSPFLKGGPELDNLHVFIPALAFSNAKVWAQGSGDKSVTETNTTALDLSSLSLPAMTQVICPCRLPVGMEDASQPAQGCMVTPTWPCPHMHTMHVPMLASMPACTPSCTHTAQCCVLHSTSKLGNTPPSDWVPGIMLARKLGLPFHPSVVERFKRNIRISFPNIAF